MPLSHHRPAAPPHPSHPAPRAAASLQSPPSHSHLPHCAQADKRQGLPLKASIELVGKELKSYKTSNEQLRLAKEKAEKSLGVLRTELKKAREDLALRTAEVEASKKEALDLRAEKEQLEKAGGSATGMNKQAVTALVKKNLARYQAKWDEEKDKLVAIGNNLVKDSFENAMAQLSLRNPGLVWDGVSHEFEVFRGQVCKVDTAARKLVNVDSGVELADWDEEGKYRAEEE
ncbi:leucine-rich repeat-containing protein [Sesbania bispinosa]|nr:leucine-rich repeat-containing protein [Sesbania bispinosa]